MRRLPLLGVATLAAALAGCPIPQPLPEYTASAITPPRILVDEIVGDGGPVIFVPAGCVTIVPHYRLAVGVVDTNVDEPFDTRWFVNYDARYTVNRTWLRQDAIPPNADRTNLVREVPPRTESGGHQFFDFAPYDFPPPPGAPTVGGGPTFPQLGILRVVELVVSNGFDPSPITTATPLPNRAPKPGFETQVFRWVFLSVPESDSVRCP